ncbi:Protein kinase C-binding protein NELL1 NEL-like protein 1 [Collichthys lucidus]|uniref:Protein kinase C-binding protein NELL1 NEL-like protein 1 n=1 Tax=Collichthys lucidus TaxID=240159 RepID=A0A4U5U5J3_COLLU|nr:Protein kinase C-binding protein NELL1 NEL-like protein 1 [Collichthys lucidus]
MKFPEKKPLGVAYIDECATQMHYCQSNTACVNLPGSHRCDCLPGFIRVDEYSCTAENRNEHFPNDLLIFETHTATD